MKMKKTCHETSAFATLRSKPSLRSTSSLQPSAFPHAFTLIELLVVISIIAILAGMVMPMFYSAKERAREAKAQVAVKALETAFKSYLDTYKVWPDGFPDVDSEISDDIFRTLRGENPGVGAGYNPQGIAFYEFGSTNSTETKAYDPWANPSDPARDTHVYRVMFDKNYDNVIDLGGGNLVYRSVVVWSPGKGGVNDSGGGDDVASWK